jgi:hypothetical protein
MESPRIVIRAEKAQYLLTSLFWAPLLVLAVVTFLKRPSSNLKEMVFLAVVLGVFIIAWVRRFRIELTDHSIKYRTLFTGTLEIQLADIESAEMQFGVTKYADRFRPPMRLELVPKSDNFNGSGIVSINLKMFSRSDIQRLVEHIQSKKSG